MAHKKLVAITVVLLSVSVMKRHSPSLMTSVPLPVGFTVEEPERPGLCLVREFRQRSKASSASASSTSHGVEYDACDREPVVLQAAPATGTHRTKKAPEDNDDDAKSPPQRAPRDPAAPFADVHRRNRALKEPKAHHPVVIIPGFVSTQLEVWEGRDCAMSNLTSSFRQRLTSASMLMKLVQDPGCFLDHAGFDPVDTSDPKGIKVRPASGIDAADYLIPSFWVWAKILRNLADVGLDATDIFMASYDWRLSPEDTELRDAYFSRLMKSIEGLVDGPGSYPAAAAADDRSQGATRRRAVILSHSYGGLVKFKFLSYADKLQPGWTHKYIESIVCIGAPLMGLPKAVGALMSGEIRDTAMLPSITRWLVDSHVSRPKRMRVFRSWTCLFALLPRGPDVWWDEVVHRRRTQLFGPHMERPDAEGVPAAADLVVAQDDVATNATSLARFWNATEGGADARPHRLTLTDLLRTLRDDSYRTGNQRLAHLLDKTVVNHNTIAAASGEPDGRVVPPDEFLQPPELAVDAPELKVYMFYGVNAATELGFDFVDHQHLKTKSQQPRRRPSGTDSTSPTKKKPTTQSPKPPLPTPRPPAATSWPRSIVFPQSFLDSRDNLRASVDAFAHSLNDVFGRVVASSAALLANLVTQEAIPGAEDDFRIDAGGGGGGGSADDNTTIYAADTHKPSPLPGGVALGDGDGTVPLFSLGYLGRSTNPAMGLRPRQTWKGDRARRSKDPSTSDGDDLTSRKGRAAGRLGAVVTREYLHDPRPAYVDPRGGRNTGDHVDILGNYELLHDVLHIVLGKKHRSGSTTKSRSPLAAPSQPQDDDGADAGAELPAVDNRILSRIDDMTVLADALVARGGSM